MKIAIMQPYLFPYIGYFQLMNSVDEFVIYDNIEFSKKGWVNRNRILANGKDAYITFPLKKDSDYAHICNRYLADIWPQECKNILNKIRESYRKAPHFAAAYPIVEKCILHNDLNLFGFILNSLKIINAYLEIQTPLVISSTIPINHDLKSGQRVMALCKERKASEYVNPIGGLELYSKGDFKQHDIELHFLRTREFRYPQFNNDFIPFLSIIDVMMFNSKTEIRQFLGLYSFE